MPHEINLITTIAAALGLALVLGYVAVRMRLPALVGYLVAGIVIGPATPGFVADLGLSLQLAEIGVMLLMFGVGLHFSVDDLMGVRRIAIPGAVVQIAVATALGAGAAAGWGWSLSAGIVFGLSLSVASTVVLIKALESRGILDTANGRIAVGWLVVEDLVMVLVLVLLPSLSGWLGGQQGHGLATGGDRAPLTTLLLTLGNVAAFVALMLVVGRRVFPFLLWRVARTGSRELFTLGVIAAALGIAFGASALFGVSFALGAFFAGMVMRESALSHRAAEDSLPLRDAFAVLFFVSVGMLFDPAILTDRPLQILAVVAIIMVGKSLAALLLVLAFRYPLNTALTVSVSLAQIGEFSFILAGMGVSLGMLSHEGQNLVLAGAIVSIAFNHLLFRAIDPLQDWLRARSRLARELEMRRDPLAALPATTALERITGHVVLVGYGRVGRRVGERLLADDAHLVVVEQNRELVMRLRERGVAAVLGDAAEPEVLIQAHVARARMLVIAPADTFRARQMIEIARTLCPAVEIVVRARGDEEAELLRPLVAPNGRVFTAEEELAHSMGEYLRERRRALSVTG